MFEVVTEPEDFTAICTALEAKGYKFLSADVEQVPDVYNTIDDAEQAGRMEKLLDLLEENDDVQNVWHNWEDNRES